LTVRHGRPSSFSKQIWISVADMIRTVLPK